jgi:hypothetical protein
MSKITTKPDVFIIESLDFDDEKEERFEGRIISQILALSGKSCKYFYIRTKRELENVLTLFAQSQYRYLHLSCHGNDNGKTMHMTLDAVPFSTLAPILTPHLRNRRLFLSACSMTNDALAKRLMPRSGCYSILGPEKTIRFPDAAIFWASLYHVLFTADSSVMTHEVIRATTQQTATMYGVPFNYIQRDKKSAKGYSLRSIKPAKTRARLKMSTS